MRVRSFERLIPERRSFPLDDLGCWLLEVLGSVTAVWDEGCASSIGARPELLSFKFNLHLTIL